MQVIYLFNPRLLYTLFIFNDRHPADPMRLTAFTDYTLRTLIYLGMHRDRLATIQDIAELHDISKNHLMKVVHQLGMSGLVETVRGRNGGLRLRVEPELINIGAVVRHSETDFYMAECFAPAGSNCHLMPSCALKGVLATATAAYLEVLDGKTLADLIAAEARPGKRPDVSTIAWKR
jgi:Rrf2 family nitric oxide-sensitive transcriptional repressor